MTKRNDGASSKRGGRKQSPAERSAAEVNLAKGRKRKREKAAQAVGRDSAAERWSKLLDGTLKVSDLEDEEIRRMKVRARDGSFNKGRAMPSHILQAFHAEAIKRSNDKLRTAAPEAVQALIDLGKDPSVRESDRIRALQYVVDRALGKTPETVHIKTDDAWGNLERDAVVDDRSLADLAGDGSDPDATA